MINSIRRFFHEHGSAILMFFANTLAWVIGIIKTIVIQTWQEIRGG